MPITQTAVLVTGVTGFVAAEITKQLLEAGYSVRGTTRNVEKATKEGHLAALEGASERLELVEADLTDPGAFSDPMQGCEYVIHTASPYILQVEDPQRDLVEPALEGTLSVLRSAAETPSVKRVLLTSSFAAISSGPREEPYSEEDWNEVSSIDNNPYSYSKTLAEKAAWDFMEVADRHFDLVVLNPSGVIGPSIVPRVNQSHEFVVGMTNGDMPAIVDLAFPSVDVRDVALAHIRAMERPEASGRYLLATASPSVRRYHDNMKAVGLHHKHSLPKFALDGRVGTIVAKAAMRTQPKGVRDFLIPNLGKRYSLDTSKAETELGIEWRDIDQTIQDAVTDLDKWGHLGKK